MKLIRNTALANGGIRSNVMIDRNKLGSVSNEKSSFYLCT